MEEIISKLESIATTSQSLSSDAAFVANELAKVRAKVEKEKEMVAKVTQPVDSRITLHVGGMLFSTSCATLQKVPDTMLSAMFSGRYQLEAHKDGSYFIDRDGTHFRWILNYLRDPESINVLLDKTILRELLLEANYYCIAPLVAAIEIKLRRYLIKHQPTVYHISNTDEFSPSDSALNNSNFKIMPLARSSNWKDLKICADSILVTAWNNIQTEEYGNFLADFVDKGGNVVLCLFSNSTSYTYPQGRFLAENYHPLVPAVYDYARDKTLGRIYLPEHPIMQGVYKVSLGSETRRISTAVSPVGSVERIADWSDGYPMVATRIDKHGLVTSIAFSIGEHGGKEDAMRMVQNALALHS